MCLENLKDVFSNFQIIIMIYLKMRLDIIMGMTKQTVSWKDVYCNKILKDILDSKTKLTKSVSWKRYTQQ